MLNQVTATAAAVALIEKLKASHGSLIFHQSGGCCDGSAPMCYPKDELYLDDSDIQLGEIADCKFYMSKSQYEYWKYSQLIIDVVEGRGTSFSLEIPLGLRFVTRSKLLEPAS